MVFRVGSMPRNPLLVCAGVVSVLAGTSSYPRAQFQERLHSKESFQAFASGTGSTEAADLDDGADADMCNSFKADKVLGRSSDLFDIRGIVTVQCRQVLAAASLPVAAAHDRVEGKVHTALATRICIALYPELVIACVCRHGFLLAALDMAKGECWAYAVYLLHTLLHSNGILPYVMMYDINCRWVVGAPNVLLLLCWPHCLSMRTRVHPSDANDVLHNVTTWWLLPLQVLQAPQDLGAAAQ